VNSLVILDVSADTKKPLLPPLSPLQAEVPFSKAQRLYGPMLKKFEHSMLEIPLRYVAFKKGDSWLLIELVLPQPDTVKLAPAKFSPSVTGRQTTPALGPKVTEEASLRME